MNGYSMVLTIILQNYHLLDVQDANPHTGIKRELDRNDSSTTLYGECKELTLIAKIISERHFIPIFDQNGKPDIESMRKRGDEEALIDINYSSFSTKEKYDRLKEKIGLDFLVKPTILDEINKFLKRENITKKQLHSIINLSNTSDELLRVRIIYDG